MNTSNKPKFFFSKIFYINLDRRPDRDENVKKQIKHLGLEDVTKRVSASDGSKLNLDEDYMNFFFTMG
jgi:GR25 family glycosyltransferase involved in LPS biosynthesis